MPTGVGFASVGFSIAGYGGVDLAPVQLQTILIDSSTGLPQNARKIDPVTGRYVLDSYGRVQGMSGVAQLVEMRAGTLLDSSAVANLGMAPPGGVVTENMTNRLTQAITLAMQDVIDQGLMKVLKVVVFKVPGTSVWRRYFTWQDLSSSGQQAGVEQKTFF